MRFFMLLPLSMCYLLPAEAQKIPVAELDSLAAAKIHALEDTLGILAYAIVNDSSSDNRFASCRQFIKTLVTTLKEENSFRYPFERLRTISIQYPADSSFRIFTWQLFVDDNTYHYYGTIQLNSRELLMYPLIDRSAEVADPEHVRLTPDNWYGAIYYHIHDFDTPSGKKYLLFGYDGYRFFTKRKIGEVLSFEGGKPVFGSPVFENPSDQGEQEIVSRLVLEYSADASVNFNFRPEHQMILFDHLVEMGSAFAGQGTMRVPDGDTDGLYLDRGIWRFKPRVYSDVLDEAPRPEPVLDQPKKDILGREKKSKKKN